MRVTSKNYIPNDSGTFQKVHLLKIVKFSSFINSWIWKLNICLNYRAKSCQNCRLSHPPSVFSLLPNHLMIVLETLFPVMWFYVVCSLMCVTFHNKKKSFLYYIIFNNLIVSIMEMLTFQKSIFFNSSQYNHSPFFPFLLSCSLPPLPFSLILLQ